jgi:hypothetical protein
MNGGGSWVIFQPLGFFQPI